MSNLKVSELKKFRESDGKRGFISTLLLKANQTRTTKTGNEFLMLELGDNSGSISAMCFDGSSAFAQLKDAPLGCAFEVAGTADFFQGRFSPKIDSARRLTDEEISAALESLAALSPYNPEDMKKELLDIISSIADATLRATVLFVLNEIGNTFFTSTAAVKMHHAYVYGLLEHTLKTARMANALAPLYPMIDRDLALSGCILHDVGKVLEYSQTLAPERTRLGILQGHVVLGYRMVRRAGIKCCLGDTLLERLEHIVLSHQGEPEWGAAVRASTPEAVFVANIDNFDAKMGAIEAAISNSGDAEFVDVSALQTKILTKKVEHQ